MTSISLGAHYPMSASHDVIEPVHLVSGSPSHSTSLAAHDLILPRPQLTISYYLALNSQPHTTSVVNSIDIISIFDAMKQPNSDSY